MAKEEANARQTTLKEDDAIELASQANEIFAAKGKKVVHINLKKDKPSREELAKLLLGPTGNLRAPTLRVGKKLIVGFDEEMYRSIFGG